MTLKGTLVCDWRSQEQGIDCEEIFSPVVRPTIICFVLGLAMAHQRSIHQLDVRNIFVHGHLQEIVFYASTSRLLLTNDILSMFVVSANIYYMVLNRQLVLGISILLTTFCRLVWLLHKVTPPCSPTSMVLTWPIFCYMLMILLCTLYLILYEIVSLVLLKLNP